MLPGLSDTSPDAERVQLDLLRRATPTRRTTLALSLSQSVCELARAAIRRLSPGLTDEEVALRFVELHYGQALAAEVRQDLARRNRAGA